MTKILLAAAWLLLIPFVATASQGPLEVVESGAATATIECVIYFEKWAERQELDCEIISIVPHPSSGE